MIVFQCYTLTNYSHDDDKDQFYEKLQTIVENWPEKDLIIMIGVLKTIVGIGSTGYEDIMGTIWTDREIGTRMVTDLKVYVPPTKLL